MKSVLAYLQKSTSNHNLIWKLTLYPFGAVLGVKNFFLLIRTSKKKIISDQQEYHSIKIFVTFTLLTGCYSKLFVSFFLPHKLLRWYPGSSEISASLNQWGSYLTQVVQSTENWCSFFEFCLTGDWREDLYCGLSRWARSSLWGTSRKYTYIPPN